MSARSAALLALVVAVAARRSLPVVRCARPGSRRRQPPPTARASAPIDLTGYWVAVVNEDWRYRMVTPPKGDYRGVPITKEALQIVNAWDPAADEAAGKQCKSYGAAAVMRLPARLHVTWQDDNTLRVDIDAGTQTRLFRFAPVAGARPGKPTWQGDSTAQWERPAAGAAVPPAGGSLTVVTTNMRAGYLRKNGVPYSENATLTEYFDVVALRRAVSCSSSRPSSTIRGTCSSRSSSARTSRRKRTVPNGIPHHARPRW